MPPLAGPGGGSGGGRGQRGQRQRDVLWPDRLRKDLHRPRLRQQEPAVRGRHGPGDSRDGHGQGGGPGWTGDRLKQENREDKQIRGQLNFMTGPVFICCVDSCCVLISQAVLKSAFPAAICSSHQKNRFTFVHSQKKSGLKQRSLSGYPMSVRNHRIQPRRCLTFLFCMIGVGAVFSPWKASHFLPGHFPPPATE